MTNIPSGAAQYLARFADQTVACNKYSLTQLGLDQSHCFLKIDDYVLLCAPFQFGFKRSLFLTSLSRQELGFFHKYTNGIVGLSMEFNHQNRTEPLKLFIRSTLAGVGQMQNRENVGLFIIDFKNTPEDFIYILGSHLEHQERLRTQYEDYGKTDLRVNADTAGHIGYNQYATVTEPSGSSRRIQVFSLSTKYIEHLEGGSTQERTPGTAVAYQLYFKKYRFSIAGTIVSVQRLPTGIIKTRSLLAFSPELVEIMDDYWFRLRSKGA